MPKSDGKLGLIGLTGLVLGSMIGGGIFNIAQNIAIGAGAAAALLSWAVVGAGVFFLVLTFKILTSQRPDLNAGIYQYALEGFGNYVGFNIAWSYWLCVIVGNVLLAIMLSNSLGAFFPIFLETWPTVIFGSIFIWVMFFIVSLGVKTAVTLNTIVTIFKLASLILVVILLIVYFKIGTFKYDFWGTMPDLGSIVKQVKSMMLVTIFCFMGIEGAIVMSNRARDSSDVSWAGIIGFLFSLVLYSLVGVLSYGIMHQAQLSKLEDPSVAYVLKYAAGDWAYYIVVVCVIVAVLTCWISWTLLCAQVPFTAAQVKILPKQFMKVTKTGAPLFGLFISSLLMQIFMILTTISKSIYMAALDMTSVTILPPYLFCGLFLWKSTYKSNYLPSISKTQKYYFRFVGIISSLFCLWLIYAGSLKLFMLCTIFYSPGIYFYYKARKENIAEGEKIFKTYEKWIAGLLLLLSMVSITMMAMGKAEF